MALPKAPRQHGGANRARQRQGIPVDTAAQAGHGASGQKQPCNMTEYNTPHAVSSPRLPIILCVDDEPNIVSALKRLFRGKGWHVLSAASGQAGLA